MANRYLIQCTLEGFEGFENDWNVAIEEFARDLDRCVMLPAQAAVTAMKSSHPYTDRTWLLTNTMDAVPGRRSHWQAEADVIFGAPYAKFVNDGTVKSRPYPFIPIGLRAAGPKLEDCVEDAMMQFCRIASGKR